MALSELGPLAFFFFYGVSVVFLPAWGFWNVVKILCNRLPSATWDQPSYGPSREKSIAEDSFSLE
jgi:hypothetical protein